MDGGGDLLTCTRAETDVWQHILREHWPYRCGTCEHATLSLTQRRVWVGRADGCGPGIYALENCLMSETARQAAHVFDVLNH